MKVHISHSRLGAAFAAELASALERAGHEPWLDREHLEPGDAWAEALDDSLTNADALVFVIDPQSQGDERQIKELAQAAEQSWQQPDKRMVPIVLADAPVPAFLRERKIMHADAEGGDWDEVADDVARAFGRRRSALGKSGQNKRGLQHEQRARLQELAAVSDELRPETAVLELRAAEIAARLATQESGDPARRATAAELADIYKRLRRPADAIAPLQIVLEAVSDAPELDAETLARAHMVLGNTLVQIDQAVAAQPHIERAAALYASAHGKDGLPEAFARLQLAVVAGRLGDEHKAATEREAALGTLKRRTTALLAGLPVIGVLFKDDVSRPRAATRGRTSRKKTKTTKKKVAKKRTTVAPAKQTTAHTAQSRARQKKKIGAAARRGRKDAD